MAQGVLLEPTELMAHQEPTLFLIRLLLQVAVLVRVMTVVRGPLQVVQVEVAHQPHHRQETEVLVLQDKVLVVVMGMVKMGKAAAAVVAQAAAALAAPAAALLGTKVVQEATVWLLLLRGLQLHALVVVVEEAPLILALT